MTTVLVLLAWLFVALPCGVAVGCWLRRLEERETIRRRLLVTPTRIERVRLYRVDEAPLDVSFRAKPTQHGNEWRN
jgi:hypothetical protein